jgi:hypothetical protein
VGGQGALTRPRTYGVTQSLAFSLQNCELIKFLFINTQSGILLQNMKQTKTTTILVFFLGGGLIWFGFWDKVSLCSPGWPQMYNLPASTS